MTVPLNTPLNSDEFTGDMIRPFQLESSSVRGRILRLNTALDQILTPHDYPQGVSQLLGEMVTLCALLSSLMKFEGIFTLQVSGNGPVSMLVADMTSQGDIRGCASFDKDRLKDVESSDAQALLGEGYIAFTVDQGQNTERYQGIVELKGNSLVESVQHYFSQSEQIETGIMIVVGQENDNWQSAGIMLQEMPEDGGTAEPNVSNVDEDDWRRAMVLMESCKETELLDSNLSSHDILLRLFHEEGVRVFAPTPLRHQCRCSDDKVKNVYKMLSEEEREEMVVDGSITMTCEFCSKDYDIDVTL